MTVAQLDPREAASTGPATGGEIIQAEDVSMAFGDVLAVQNLSLNVSPGTILGVIGPSGAGKTTTVRLMTGALGPTRGRIRVLDEDPRFFHRKTRERIGYMPQLFTLYPDLTAGENVDFVASLFGLLWTRRRKRVKEVLHIVDLWDARKRRASDLSGGMQRRLELASALVHDPELLFLDEPTAGIDPLLRARIWEELHRLRNAGHTLIVTTQYVNEAEECDQVALIAQGRLAALATPDDLRRQATGGDIIEVETERAFDVRSLTTLPIVLAGTQTGPRTFRVAVEDSATAMPDVVAAVRAAGGEVLTSKEYRPTFDEIFTELVERQRVQLEREEGLAEGHERNEVEARQLVEERMAAREADGRTSPAERPDDGGYDIVGSSGDGYGGTEADAARPLAHAAGTTDAPLAAEHGLPGTEAELTPEERAAADERLAADARLSGADPVAPGSFPSVAPVTDDATRVGDPLPSPTSTLPNPRDPGASIRDREGGQ